MKRRCRSALRTAFQSCTECRGRSSALTPGQLPRWAWWDGTGCESLRAGLAHAQGTWNHGWKIIGNNSIKSDYSSTDNATLRARRIHASCHYATKSLKYELWLSAARTPLRCKILSIQFLTRGKLAWS